MGEFKLVHCDNQNLLDEMHNIRERVLFTDGKYDRRHPDDTNTDNQCFVFILNDKPVATVRLDFIRSHEYALRLVAVLPEYQGKKIGSKMMSVIFDYAKQKGIYKLVTNSAIEAVKFYESLGFIKEHWIDTGEGISRPTVPMAKNLTLNPKLVKATLSDYPTIQNMARFYVYELSRYCGCISDEWSCPPDGLYADTDLKHYFQDPERCAYLIKLGEELAGFALLHHIVSSVDDYWVMAEFFILAKFQGQGIGAEVAEQLWIMYPGKWEVPIIPENKKALAFWRQTISSFTNANYQEEIHVVDYDVHQPKRYILSFNTKEKVHTDNTISVRKATESDISRMNQLSYTKRRDYEEAQPQFWRYAEGAEEVQMQWFKELMQNEDSILLIAEMSHEIKGFIIGRLTSAPPVYNPGGLTLMIDDFCVAKTRLWNSVGKRLISEIQQHSRDRSAAQILVTCGAHDEPKSQFLKEIGLSVVSEWYIGDIIKK